MAGRLSDDPRSETNPLFNQNKLRLGLFAINCNGTATMSFAPDQYKLTWENSLDVATKADQAGLEAIVPVARWHSFGDEHHWSGKAFDNFTWSAAVSARTGYSSIMSTCHTSVFHPLIAAKSSVTNDHISNGRFALNIVCGWFQPEIEMFGAPQMGHDERYDRTDEWTTALKKLWTDEDAFDFEGKYIRVIGGMSQPKPIQRPYPALMNAGGSPRGQAFVAKHCDLAFIQPHNPEDNETIRRQIDAYRKLAWEQYRREVQVWSTTFIVQRDSLKEAQKQVEYLADEWGDNGYADMFITQNIANAQTMPHDQLRSMRRAIKLGIGSIPVIGTPENIADRLATLSECGLDGVLLVWLDTQKEIRPFIREVLPLLEQSGLRHPRPALKKAPF